jgi:hypothetical protein
MFRDRSGDCLKLTCTASTIKSRVRVTEDHFVPKKDTRFACAWKRTCYATYDTCVHVQMSGVRGITDEAVCACRLLWLWSKASESDWHESEANPTTWKLPAAPDRSEACSMDLAAAPAYIKEPPPDFHHHHRTTATSKH